MLVRVCVWWDRIDADRATMDRPRRLTHPLPLHPIPIPIHALHRRNWRINSNIMGKDLTRGLFEFMCTNAAINPFQARTSMCGRVDLRTSVVGACVGACASVVHTAMALIYPAPHVHVAAADLPLLVLIIPTTPQTYTPPFVDRNVDRRQDEPLDEWYVRSDGRIWWWERRGRRIKAGRRTDVCGCRIQVQHPVPTHTLHYTPSSGRRERCALMHLHRLKFGADMLRGAEVFTSRSACRALPCRPRVLVVIVLVRGLER